MLNNKKCVPCQGGIPPLNADEISVYIKKINSEWSIKEDKKIIKNFNFGTYKSAIKFSNQVAELSESQGHHPYIHINFKQVKIILYTHKIGGLHENDFLMASKIDKLIISL